MKRKELVMKELYVEVLVKKRYLFPITMLAMSKECIVNDFFKNFNINQNHATRDSYHIGNGDKIISIKTKDFDPNTQSLDEIINPKKRKAKK